MTLCGIPNSRKVVSGLFRGDAKWISMVVIDFVKCPLLVFNMCLLPFLSFVFLFCFSSFFFHLRSSRLLRLRRRADFRERRTGWGKEAMGEREKGDRGNGGSKKDGIYD